MEYFTDLKKINHSVAFPDSSIRQRIIDVDDGTYEVIDDRLTPNLPTQITIKDKNISQVDVFSKNEEGVLILDLSFIFDGNNITRRFGNDKAEKRYNGLLEYHRKFFERSIINTFNSILKKQNRDAEITKLTVCGKCDYHNGICDNGDVISFCECNPENFNSYSNYEFCY